MKNTIEKTISNTNDLLQKYERFLYFFFFVLIAGLYVYNISQYFWSYPDPGDPITYLRPVTWRTLDGWRFADRWSFAIGLSLFVRLLPVPAYMVGIIYNAFINTLILLLGMIWLSRKSSIYSAILFGLFYSSSFIPLRYATSLYPDQSLALFTFIVFIFFFSSKDHWRGVHTIYLAGFFSAIMSSSKIIGWGALIFFLLYLIYQKNWEKLRKYTIGIIIGGITIVISMVALFGVNDVFYSISEFFTTNIKATTVAFDDEFVSYVALVLDIKYFPFFALLILPVAYQNSNTRNLFVVAWANIGFMYVHTLLLPRGRGPFPHYVYTAFLFSVLGFTLYLGEALQEYVKRVKENNLKWLSLEKINALIFTILGIFLIWYGIRRGIILYNPKQYTPTAFPIYIKWLYIGTPLILFVGLILIQLKKLNKLFFAFLLIIVFWNASYNGGWAYHANQEPHKTGNYYYEGAQLLSTIPQAPLYIYIESWINLRDGEDVVKVFNTFPAFFEVRLSIIDDFEGNDEGNANNRITFLTKKSEVEDIESGFILIEDIPTVLSLLPDAVAIDEYVFQNKILYLYQIP